MSDTGVTVHCRDCGFITDLNLLSDSNIEHCPDLDCMGQLYIVDTDIKFPEAEED